MTESECVALRKRHRHMLLVTCLVVVLAFLLDIRSDQRVHVRGLSDYALPPTCFSYVWFQVECPGCGLTRSFILLAAGDFAASFERHRIGWLLAAAFLIQFPYRIIALRGKRLSPLGQRIPRIFGYGLLVALIGNWLLKMLA